MPLVKSSDEVKRSILAEYEDVNYLIAHPTGVGDGEEAERTRASPLVPPQVEKAEITQKKGPLGRIVDRIQVRSSTTQSVSKPPYQDIQDAAQDKVMVDTVRAGAAGVTGEDFGLQETRRYGSR